jgi:gluconolactonase
MIVFGYFYRCWKNIQRNNDEGVSQFFSARLTSFIISVLGSKHRFLFAFVFVALGLVCSEVSSVSVRDVADNVEDREMSGMPNNGMCPPKPYASAPFTGSSVTAQVVVGSTSDLYDSGLVEGPVWINATLYLSSFSRGKVPPSTILTLQTDGTLAVAIPNAGSNGLAVDAEGMIVAATHDDGGLSRYNPANGERTVIVNSYMGSRLNSPNDLSIASDGTIFFTDPNWQAPTPDPQPVEGVYQVNPAGVITLVDGSIGKPNGIALSNDEAWLYVGHPGGMVRYAVAADMTVTTPGVAFGSGLAGVDGLAMDCADNIYVTQHSDGVVVVLNADGATIGTINVAPSLTNAAFGGPEGKTLYLTAGDPAAGGAVYSVELEIPGRPY